jgi:hypothetical protein
VDASISSHFAPTCSPLLNLFPSSLMARRRVAKEPDNPAPANRPPPARNTRSHPNEPLVGPATPARNTRSQSNGAPAATDPPAKKTRSQSKGTSKDLQDFQPQTLQNNTVKNVAKPATAKTSAPRNHTNAPPSSPSQDVPLTKTGPPRGQKRARRMSKKPAARQGGSVSDNSDARPRLVIL